MVSTRVIESVITDTIKNHPAVFIFALALVAGLLYFSYSTFALKADLQSVELRIAARLMVLEIQADKRDTEMQIRALEAEMFDLERLEKAQQATRRDMQRLWKLKKTSDRLESGRAQMASALQDLERGLARQ